MQSTMAADWPACSSMLDRQVGEGGAQRLLARGGHVAPANVQVVRSVCAARLHLSSRQLPTCRSSLAAELVLV